MTNPGGRTDRLASAYTYVGFTLTTVSPQRGLVGDLLRIQGTAFSTNAVVTIGAITVGVIQPTSTQLIVFAPSLPPGNVEVTVTNADGQRRTFPPGFTYEAVAISASPNPVKVQSPLTVTWEVPPGRSASDWIGLFRVGDPPGKEIWWQYTGALVRGTVTIAAPYLAGDYDFRYFPDEGYIEAGRSESVTVIPGAGDVSADAPSWIVAPRLPGSPLTRPGRGRGTWCATSRCG